MTIVCIDFINDLTLRFKVYDNPVAYKWLDRIEHINNYQLDDAKRFYGFNSQTYEETKAVQLLQDSIDIINSYSDVIKRTVKTVYDQDTLNYLHSCFEQYHGLLDKNAVFWKKAPAQVKQALVDLNNNIHRCENVQRGIYPRLVCTWYGMPKTVDLTANDLNATGVNNIRFGDVCINYCEIGKTLDDLAVDEDNYVSAEAFQPYKHVSADFKIIFHEFAQNRIDDRLNKMKEYYARHIDFFQKLGYNSFYDPRLMFLFFPVAGLVENMPKEKLIDELRTRQQVMRVYLE